MAFSIGVVASVFANIDAENTAVLDKLLPTARDVGEQGVYALVVKSHAVDDRFDFSGNAKQRGLGLPFCGRGVMVPISIKPKPMVAESTSMLAILSNPAARPTRLGKVKPSMNAVGCWPEFWVKAESVRRVREFE